MRGERGRRAMTAGDALPPPPPSPPSPPATYCAAAHGHPVHGPYHDHEYGVPLRDDDRLFERLVLEINQAGLSWLTILKKRDGFRHAYDGFAVARVAAYGDADRARLLGDAGIVRNRLKVAAAIENARRILGLRETHVLAHERLGVVEGALEYGHVLHRADVAEHHGGVAPQHRQLRTLHRRAAERRAVGIDVHREHLARERARVLPRERRTWPERRAFRQLMGESDVPRADGLGRVAPVPDRTG
jgi:hypothetical protein